MVLSWMATRWMACSSGVGSSSAGESLWLELDEELWLSSRRSGRGWGRSCSVPAVLVLSLRRLFCWGTLGSLKASCIGARGWGAGLVWVAVVRCRWRGWDTGCVPPLGQTSQRNTSILQLCCDVGLWPSTLLSVCGRAITSTTFHNWKQSFINQQVLLRCFSWTRFFSLRRSSEVVPLTQRACFDPALLRFLSPPGYSPRMTACLTSSLWLRAR